VEAETDSIMRRKTNIFSGMEMGVERAIQTLENGQEESLYCKICYEELSREFYNDSGIQVLLRVNDCEHYQWIFVGDPFLDPPWDLVTREIINNAVAKVDASGGKYFLLPRSLAERYSN